MIDTTKPVGRYRWVVVALLFFATTINYLDRQVIGLLKPVLEKDFNCTETDYSHIVMAFSASYALGLLVFGRIIDTIGTKLGYIISVIVWSIAAMLHAIVTSTLGFGVVRSLLGLGESGNFPAAIKSVAEWFPRKERAAAGYRLYGYHHWQHRWRVFLIVSDSTGLVGGAGPAGGYALFRAGCYAHHAGAMGYRYLAGRWSD